MRRRRQNPLPLDQRLTVTVDYAADALDVGRSKVYDLVRRGELRMVDIGGMRRVSGESLRRLVYGDTAIGAPRP